MLMNGNRLKEAQDVDALESGRATKLAEFTARAQKDAGLIFICFILLFICCRMESVSCCSRGEYHCYSEKLYRPPYAYL